MDETVEAIIDCLTNHLSSRNKLGVKTMENVFQVLSFSWFFRIEKLQKLLNERWSYMNF